MKPLEDIVEDALYIWNPQWRSSPRAIQEHQRQGMRRVVLKIMELLKQEGRRNDREAD